MKAPIASSWQMLNHVLTWAFGSFTRVSSAPKKASCRLRGVNWVDGIGIP